MAIAIPFKSAFAPSHTAPAVTGTSTRLRPWAAIKRAIVESRRRKAQRELRRLQAFTPLIGIKYVGLTLEELLIPMTWHD